MNALQRRLFINNSSDKNTPLLPPEYQRVEWIETVIKGQSFYGSYVLLPLTANQDTEIEIKCQLTLPEQATNILYGSKLGLGYNATTQQYTCRFSSTDAVRSGITPSFSKMDTIKLSKEGFFINGVKAGVELFQGNWTDIYPATLFAYAPNGPTGYCYVSEGLRAEEFIWRQSGVKQIHLLSCYNKNSGVVGMYDLCGNICPKTNSSLFKSYGVAEFLKGADV